MSLSYRRLFSLRKRYRRLSSLRSIAKLLIFEDPIRSLASLRYGEPNPLQKISKSLIRTKAGQDGINFQVHQPDISLLERFLQHLESLVFIAKPCIDCCNRV